MSKRNISINPKCYDDAESRAKHRADWIADHHKKLQEEKEKRQIEAAELKLKLLDEKFENDEYSDESEQEPEHVQRQINERVDGLAEYQRNIPLSCTKYNDFIKTLKNISASSTYIQACKELQLLLSRNPDWQNDEKSDYDIQKLLDTSLLRAETDKDVMSWQMAKLVGLYICKHSSSSRKQYLIANLVANESSDTKTMEPDKFVDAIRPILRMAAIEFTKAVFETKFMEQLFDDSHFNKLESGINKICNDLKLKVFEEATELNKKEWVRKAMMPDF